MERRGPKIKKLIKENKRKKAKELREKEKFDNSSKGKLLIKIMSIIEKYDDETYKECEECDMAYIYNKHENEWKMYNEIREIFTTKKGGDK